MKPIIKWSGGKSKELPIVHKYKPNKINTYREPFIGGGAVWLNLNHDKNVVSDNFVDLVEFYNTIKLYKEDCIEHINNNFTEPLDKALKFYILRQLSFSGMLRFNSKTNKYNVPFGWYKNLKVLDYGQDLYNLLDNTEIISGNWKTSVQNVEQDDFVFLDPPYTRKFQNYSPFGSFGEKEHIELADWFKSSQSNNMLILNKDEFTYDLYKDYIVDEYNYKYSIQYRDRMKDDDSNAIHFVAINYEVEQNKLSFQDFQ